MCLMWFAFCNILVERALAEWEKHDCSWQLHKLRDYSSCSSVPAATVVGVRGAAGDTDTERWVVGTADSQEAAPNVELKDKMGSYMR